MPELPEVEIISRQLKAAIKPQDGIVGIQFLSPKLRTDLKLPKKLKFPLMELHIERRSKFLIFSYLGGGFISHLGMTGSWRILNQPLVKKHDHILIKWKSGSVWLYNDPRRFGVFEFLDERKSSKWLANLGQEPLLLDIDFEKLIDKIKNSSRAIKDTIMDAKIIVGVGNIYACESLYLARLNPFKKAQKNSRADIKVLLLVIQKVLNQAIEKGGSSIQNFSHSDGSKGQYQKEHLVYGRDGEKCVDCKTIIRRKLFHGRGTFWCPKCQK